MNPWSSWNDQQNVHHQNETERNDDDLASLSTAVLVGKKTTHLSRHSTQEYWKVSKRTTLAVFNECHWVQDDEICYTWHY